MRVYELRKIGEDLHHLVGSLSAGSHNYHFCISLTGDCVLEYCFSASEGAGDKAGASLRNGVEGVHTAYSGLHHAVGTWLFDIPADSNFDRPLLDHCHFALFAFRVREDCYGIIYLVVPLRSNALNGEFSIEGEGDHNLVMKPALHYLSEPVSGKYFVTRFSGRCKVPLSFVIQRFCVFSSLEKNILHCFEVVLKSVKTAGEKSGTQGGFQHMACKLNFVTLF